MTKSAGPIELPDKPEIQGPEAERVTKTALANYVVNSDPDGVDHGLKDRGISRIDDASQPCDPLRKGFVMQAETWERKAASLGGRLGRG